MRSALCLPCPFGLKLFDNQARGAFKSERRG